MAHKKLWRQSLYVFVISTVPGFALSGYSLFLSLSLSHDYSLIGFFNNICHWLILSVSKSHTLWMFVNPKYRCNALLERGKVVMSLFHVRWRHHQASRNFSTKSCRFGSWKNINIASKVHRQHGSGNLKKRQSSQIYYGVIILIKSFFSESNSEPVYVSLCFAKRSTFCGLRIEYLSGGMK